MHGVRFWDKAQAKPQDSLLRLARTASGLSQTDLAARALISQSLLCHYEKGTKRPTAAIAARLAFALALDVSDLFPDLKEDCHASQGSDPR